MTTLSAPESLKKMNCIILIAGISVSKICPCNPNYNTVLSMAGLAPALTPPAPSPSSSPSPNPSPVSPSPVSPSPNPSPESPSPESPNPNPSPSPSPSQSPASPVSPSPVSPSPASDERASVEEWGLRGTAVSVSPVPVSPSADPLPGPRAEPRSVPGPNEAVFVVVAFVMSIMLVFVLFYRIRKSGVVGTAST